MNKELFKPGNLHGNAHVGYVRNIPDATENYATCYRNAALVLTESISNSYSYNDHDACPIVFLFRHAIELYLKSIILSFVDLQEHAKSDSVKISEIKKTLEKHELNPLLGHVKTALIYCWNKLPDEDMLSLYQIGSWVDVENMIDELDNMDDSSQTFRYPTSKQGYRLCLMSDE